MVHIIFSLKIASYDSLSWNPIHLVMQSFIDDDLKGGSVIGVESNPSVALIRYPYLF